METVIDGGDVIHAGGGDLVKAYGADAVFMRGQILMNMRKERFYLRPEMGTCLTKDDFKEPEKVEMLLNEALTPIQGLTAIVTEVNGLTAKVRLIYADSTKDCEVTLDEYI